MKYRSSLLAVAAVTLLPCVHAQSTATLSGTVKDPSGAVLPGAQIVIRNVGTGIERALASDSAGQYVAASLPPGDYTVTATASGFGTFTAQRLTLLVDARANLDIAMSLAAAGESVQVEAAATLINAETITVGQVIERTTVQEVPLNGRHFLDLTVLTPGGVTAPANGNLTTPSRGLGANSFITAGNRDDSVNFQINGVNLNDMVQNQITFQPSINTTSEFKINNQTFSAEYGRSSGSIVNVSTRSGTNAFHGEVFDYLRNEALDARNYFNPKGTPIAPFKRNNFGGALGGPIWKNHTFFFASYEGLRQAQGLTVNSGVLTLAQRAAVTDPVSQKLLAFIPLPNATSSTSAVPDSFVGIAAGPVTTDQGTIDIQHTFSPADTLHGFYAIQKDVRTEPTLQGNTVSGFGDHRAATRQILTLNETHVFSPRLVNEARLGFNRIAISFNQNVTTDPTTLGLIDGNTGAAGLPQITITGPGINFGGPSGFPQGREDTFGIFSDTASLTLGQHNLKFGGEFRRFLNANFSGDTGTLGFNSVANFQAGHATTFSVTPGTLSNRIYVNAVGGFLQDAWKITPDFTAELGFRYEWNGSPVEGNNRFTVFDVPSVSLIQVGTNGYGKSPYSQNNNYEPRAGFAYDVNGQGKTVLRAAYGYMADQPETNLVSGLNSNPPFRNSVTFTNSTATPYIPVENLYASAGAAGIAVSAVARNYKNAYTQTFNFNVQQALPAGIVTTIGYYGSVGRHLRQPVNINQPSATGVRPFTALATTSPFLPGRALGVNINQSTYVGQSNYNGMWLSAQKTFRNGFNFSFNYALSKSLDLGSLASTTLQDATRPYLNYGPSDFDTRNRIAFNAVYVLPFHGNRLVEGWQISGITQWQTGNPLNVTTTSTFTGTSGVLHPNLLRPVNYVKTKSSATRERWFTPDLCTNTLTNTSTCVFQALSTGFGNLSRNALVGPGFSDTDFSIEKNTTIFEGLKFQIRADAFDIFNHASFGNPNTSIGVTTTAPTAANPNPTIAANPNFGLISATRFAVGDLGSSRQLQIVGKLIF